MGYKGLVICDDLEMGGALQGRTMEQAAIEAISAGCDVLLLCGAQANTERVFRALSGKADSDVGFRALIRAAAENVLAFKRSWNSPHPATNRPDIKVLREDIAALNASVHTGAHS